MEKLELFLNVLKYKLYQKNFLSGQRIYFFDTSLPLAFGATDNLRRNIGKFHLHLISFIQKIYFIESPP